MERLQYIDRITSSITKNNPDAPKDKKLIEEALLMSLMTIAMERRKVPQEFMEKSANTFQHVLNTLLGFPK